MFYDDEDDDDDDVDRSNNGFLIRIFSFRFISFLAGRKLIFIVLMVALSGGRVSF